MVDQTAIEKLGDLLRERQPCVVLTGAGISTESGIPDFRSPTGIWAEYDPMEYATIDAFRRDPVKVWEFHALRLDALATAQPNAGHLALAELERRGALERAAELARAAGLLLVVGSSLEVYPVAALPEETLSGGGALAIVNRGPTPYDGRADLKVHAGAGEALSTLLRA